MAERPDNPIRLLLVNEIRLMGNVIAAAIEGEADIEVAASVTTPEEALAIIRECRVDIALVSTRLPDQGALTLTREIAQTAPQTKVLVLGLTEEKERVLRYLEAGASGYVLKDDSLNDMLTLIRHTCEGKIYFPPHITAALIKRLYNLAQRFLNIKNTMTEDANLTPRELEILHLIDQDMTNQEIADELVIEVGTVKNHVHNILEKLNVNSRMEATAYLTLLKK